jgi:Arylsulfotransferase (ASST)
MGITKKFLAAIIVAVVLVFVLLFGMMVENKRLWPRNQMHDLVRATRSLFTEQDASQKIFGRWGTARSNVGTVDPTMDELADLPYLQGYVPPGEKSGVTINLKQQSQPGLTLFCSGHAPFVYLMDNEGKIVHQWSKSFDEVYPELPPFHVDPEHREFFRKPYLFPNGDLLTNFEYVGLIKLDKDSNLLWKYTDMNHHDVTVTADGTIYTLGREPLPLDQMRAKYPGIPLPRDAWDDLVIILDAQGKEQDRISILDAFYNSEYAAFLGFLKGRDIFHANSVRVIENPANWNSDIFTPGDILVSLRRLSTIILIDPEKKAVKWALTGQWHEQHQAIYLENGNILLFDNLGANRDEFFRFDRTKVIEINPLTQKIVWEFTGAGNDYLFSHWLGHNQRLANGNTLITESANGRLLEVAVDGHMVWEYVSPFRAGENKELIATLMGAQRIDFADITFLGDN